MSSQISEALRRLVAERGYHVCEYCLIHEEDAYHGCEVDHIVSLKHGGLTVPENLANACFHCNRRKGTDVGSIDVRTGKFVRLFHPRADRWRDHFYLSEGRIEPLTDIGEVTSRVLDLNHPKRVTFRKLLAGIGRYPTLAALARMQE
jgi:hypothetical protein